MAIPNYTTTSLSVTIELTKSPADVFDHLLHDVPGFWPEEMEGTCTSLDDEFIFRSGDSHYSKNKVIELIPDKRLVWLVTQSLRKPDNFDWTGTKMIFALVPHGAHTLLTFTYDGVILADEYARLVQVCDWVIKENLYNRIEKSYTAAIETKKPPHEVFGRITKDVANWWGGEDLEGKSTRLNDEFIINHPGTHYSKKRVTELIPDKKVTWLVTESTLHWLKDQQEWKNTKMIFDISQKEDKTVLHFTHLGLTPDKESYARCSEGWNTVIKDWLLNFIDNGQPHFQPFEG